MCLVLPQYSEFTVEYNSLMRIPRDPYVDNIIFKTYLAAVLLYHKMSPHIIWNNKAYIIEIKGLVLEKGWGVQ